MQEADNTSTLEIVGRGGLVAHPSSHDADPKAFAEFLDVITDLQGRIRKRPGIGNAVGAVAPGVVTAMHEFSRYNDGAIDYYLLRATDTTIEYRKNGGAWTLCALPYEPTPGGLWVFETVDTRCVATNGKDEAIVFDGADWRILGVEGPLSAMGYILSTPYGLGTVSITQGTVHILGTAGAIWNPLAVDGKTIEINGVRYTVDHVTVAGDGAGTAPQADLIEQVKEVSAGGLPYRIFDGVCEWEEAPIYAYGYENPATGHASNVRHSSLTTDNTTRIVEKDQIGRTITLNNIAYDPVAYAQGYTKIRIYRTPRNSTVLVGMSTLLDNAAAPGTTSFTETADTWNDASLTFFPAERTRLAKPPAGMAACRVRMGRLCAAHQNRLRYSLHEVEVVDRLGVFYEAFPSKNNRLVNAIARGLVRIGMPNGSEALVVQTSAGDFVVSGFDDDMAVPKMATRDAGSYQYGAIDLGRGQLLSLYDDHRLVAYPGDDDYGFPIQGLLNAVELASIPSARLHRFSGDAGAFILLSVAKSSESVTNDVTYVLDLNTEAWYQWGVGFTAFATAHDPASGALELWASNAAGKTFHLLQAGVWQDEGVDFAPKFTTVARRPFGELAFGEIVQMTLFVSNASFDWSGEVLVNETASGSGLDVTFTASEFDTQSAQGRELQWTPTQEDRTRGKSYALTVTMPSGNSDFYVEKAILVARAGQTVPVEQ